MKVFVTADHHFGHVQSIKAFKRPFKNVGEMNKELIKKWNTTVNPEDLVFHLGDFSYRVGKEYIGNIRKSLNGTIILIQGNHDNKRILKHLNFILVNGPIKIDNLILTHKPMYKVPHNKVNLHGHIHTKYASGNYHINCCVENTNYEPVRIEKYKEMANDILQKNKL